MASPIVPAASHQQFQAFPNLDSPIANPDLTISIPWYQLLLGLFQRTGGSGVPANANPVYDISPGSPAQGQVLTTNPFVFTSPEFGALLVTRNYSVNAGSGVRGFAAGGETIEFSRNSGTTWYLAGTAPRLLPVLFGDMIRVSWFTAVPPQVLFFGVSPL